MDELLDLIAATAVELREHDFEVTFIRREMMGYPRTWEEKFDLPEDYLELLEKQEENIRKLKQYKEEGQ